MDAVDLWLLRYEPIHTFVADDLVAGLTEAQVRGRPVPGVNPIAWLIWHAMRIEDVCVNRFVLDRPQVLDAGWPSRLRVSRCDEQLRGYCRAVTRATLDAAPLLRGLDLEVSVPAERVTRVCTEEGAVDPGATWLTEFWAGGRSRGWIVAQTSLLHVYGHYFEGLATKGLWGARSR